MFRLRKIYPPFGTETTPLHEHAYSEQVVVTNGICEVESPVTRDYLLNLGYELVEDVEPDKAEVPRPKPRRGKS